MNTRQQSLTDARQKLGQRDARFILNRISTRSKMISPTKAKKFDARNKLNTLSKLKSGGSKFDARLKIKGNKTTEASPVRTKPASGAKFSLIRTIMSENLKQSGTSRTIRNPSALAMQRKTENVKDFLKQPTGFVSVTGETVCLVISLVI